MLSLHLLKSLIKLLREYLKPGGVVVVEVPCLYDPLLSVYDNRAYLPFFYHSEHLFYFTPKSLTQIMGEGGFRGELTYVQDYNFTNHMNWIYQNGPQPNCLMGMGKPQLPLSNHLPDEVRDDFNAWLADVGASYKKLLVKHELTENITFIGTKK